MDELYDSMRIDPFDDWPIPPDDEWADFVVVDDDQANRMVRKARNLQAFIADEEAKRDAEVERVTRITADRTHGAKRALNWILDTLASFQRAVLAADERAPRTLRLVAGATVKATGIGGQPQIQDPATYRMWAIRHDHFDRGTDIKLDWETVHLAAEALRAAVEGDIGGRTPATITSIAERLEAASVEQMKLLTPSYAKKGGRIAWRGENWYDVQTGEVVPGLGRVTPGFNVTPTVDR